MTRRAGRFFCAAAALLASFAGARAADPGLVEMQRVIVGVPCDGPEAKTFESVWLGHFSGGYSHYLGEGGPIALDWRDEKLCFPSRGSCRRYVADMRRDFHRPEGYSTCLPIR